MTRQAVGSAGRLRLRASARLPVSGIRCVLLLLAASCAPLPKVELDAYTTAYTDVYNVTNGVLDVVQPYERVVIRNAALSISAADALQRVAAAQDAAPFALMIGATEGRPLPPPDPELLADPSVLRPPRQLPPPDLGLLAPVTRPPPASSTSTVRARALPVDVPSISCRGVSGDAPYCYETRDGYADIGDPPLVDAYRRLATVVYRFNALLLAYANGISGTLLQQELDQLTTSVSDVAALGPLVGIGGAGAFTTSFNGVVGLLAPIAQKAGETADRARLRSFLLENYAAVDQALVLMARNSVDLYANVAVGTNLFRRMQPPGAGQALITRRDAIRRMIANWTKLLDNTRGLLREFKVAIEAPNGLETRLRNLDPAVKIRLESSLVQKEISALGTPTLMP